MEEKKIKISNINIFQIIRILMADKKKVLIYSITAGVIGVALAFATPKIYKSTVTLAPEESNNGFTGSISSLASLVGMNMKIGQTGDALYPEIYPELMSSTRFLLGLFPISVTTQKTHETFSYQDYLLNHQQHAFYEYPTLWIGKLLEKMKSEEKPVPNHKTSYFQLTKKEDGIASAIKNNINCSVDKKTNVITIVVKDQDPLIAAIVADSVQKHLQQTITDYRTKKARVDLIYMEELYQEALKQYQKARHKYAAYSDANRMVTSLSVQSVIDDLESDMQLKYNIYHQVVEQMHLAKAKVQERTPAFTIIQDAVVPIKHSNLPKIVTLIIWMVLGFLVRTGILIWRNRRFFFNI